VREGPEFRSLDQRWPYRHGHVQFVHQWTNAEGALFEPLCEHQGAFCSSAFSAIFIRVGVLMQDLNLGQRIPIYN
jgi:hypothetical protein